MFQDGSGRVPPRPAADPLAVPQCPPPRRRRHATALALLSLEEAVKTAATSPGDLVGSENGAVPRPEATFAMMPTGAGCPKTDATPRRTRPSPDTDRDEALRVGRDSRHSGRYADGDEPSRNDEPILRKGQVYVATRSRLPGELDSADRTGGSTRLPVGAFTVS